MKKWFIVLLAALLFVFLTSAVWAGQKFSLNSQETPSKFFLGQLIQTCKGLVILPYPGIAEPIILNSDIPQKYCHIGKFWNPDVKYWEYWCVEGAGSPRCLCETIYIPQ